MNSNTTEHTKKHSLYEGLPKGSIEMNRDEKKSASTPREEENRKNISSSEGVDRPADGTIENGKALGFMVFVGVLIISFFGFGTDTPLFQAGITELLQWGWLVPDSGIHVSHWRCWEMGAVIWAILFGFYYLFVFPFTMKESLNKVICVIVIFGGIGSNVAAAYFILKHFAPSYHVLAIFAVAMFYMITDFLLYQGLTDRRKKVCYYEGLLMADIPIVVASLVLLVYLVNHGGHDDMDAFTGGAISFQLIASNAIFVVSQGGFIRRAWETHGCQETDQRESETGGRQIPGTRATSKENEIALGESRRADRPTPGLGRNRDALTGIALISGLLGLIAVASRFLVDSLSPSIGIAGLVMGLIAFLVGLGGRLSGAGSSNLGLTLGALVLVFAVLPVRRPPIENMKEFAPLPITDSGGELITSVALSSDGGTLARGGGDQKIKVFDTKTGELQWETAYGGPVHALTFSPDGKILASGGNKVTGKLWRAATGEELLPLSTQRYPGDHSSALMSLEFSSTGEILAGGTSEGSIGLWDTQTGELRWTLQGTQWIRHEYEVLALAFSTDGKWLVSGGKDQGKVILWDMSQLENDERGRPRAYRGFNDIVYSVAVSRDGSTLAAGTMDSTVLLWDRGRQDPPRFTMVENRGKDGQVRALIFSADDRFLASASEDPGLILWDTRRGKKLRTVQANSRPATAIGLSRDGWTLVGGSDGKLNVWRAE